MLVPPIGPLDARIILIGEAPGKEEADSGIPFVGQAGELLNRCLAAARIPRTSVYITNVVKERPPNNDITHFIDFDKEGNAIPTDAYCRYESELHTELCALPNATVLVPLGNVAMWALLRGRNITKRRGSIYSCNLYGRDFKVIPTFHPASALRGRDPVNEYIIKWDLLRIREEAETPELNLPQRNLLINPTYGEAMEWLHHCQQYGMLGFDIESSTKRIKGKDFTVEMVAFSLACADGSMCIPLIHPDRTSRWTAMEELSLLRALARCLQDPDKTIIGQNLAYDFTVMFQRYGVYIADLEDTMVAQSILFQDLDRNLGFLCSLHTREPYYKEAEKRWTDDTPFDAFQKYSAMDSAVVLDIWPKLYALLQQQGNWDTYDRQRNSMYCAQYIQEHGLLANRESLSTLKREVVKEIKVLQDDLNSIVFRTRMQKDKGFGEAYQALKDSIEASKAKGRGVKGKLKKLHDMETLNVKSGPQKMAYFYKLLGFRKPAQKPTDKDAIDKLAVQGCVEAKAVATITRLRDDVAKYYTVKLDPDSRMRTLVKVVGTESGRWSTAKTLFGTGVSFQQQPTRMRDHISADPGYMFIELDYSQAENRIVAYLAGDQHMMHAFETGQDVHKLTASLIFGVPVSEVTKEQRQIGKKCNHALNYRMGAAQAAVNMGLSLKDATWCRTRYHQVYTGVSGTFWADVERDVLTKKRLVNLRGRIRQFLGYPNMQSAIYYIPQSTVPDMVNEWGMWHMWNNPQYEDFRLCAQVHDSILMQVPRTMPTMELVDALNALRDSMQQLLVCKGRTFSIPVDMKSGGVWGKMKEIPRTEWAEGLERIKYELDQV